MAKQFKNRIYLIGLMGVGKTTVGERLATLLRYDFIDTDNVIKESLGIDIPLLFEIKGEDYFRRQETKVLKQTTLMEPVVIATGGGIIKSRYNRTLMRKSGIVIYLSANIRLIYERTQYSKNRPLLNVKNRKDKIQSLYNERDPLYRRCAHLIVENKNSSAKQMALKLSREIKKYGKNRRQSK